MRKDFFREIKKSLGRFLSIFFIVALGVSLFTGIRATEPDMRLSGDAYVDDNRLMDIKVMASTGLSDSDVEIISQTDGIRVAEGAYSIDVLCQAKENKKVLHIMSETKHMNEVTVEKGRMPVAENECLVDQDFMEKSGYQIGDILKVESGTEQSLNYTLKETEFKIVGSGNSPCYFSLDRGSSAIGDGSISGFVVVSPNAFVLPVYTEVYALVEGAMEETAFTDAYEELVATAIEKVQRPGWYVFDRSSIPEYTGYGENADRIAALALVFPTMFFLVAALISLTTMTRMVEEQRVQIGTLKALGYSKFAIMRKYLLYALLATLGGSIFGVLVGEKLFPYVIIVAYKILYQHIPHVLVPYHWDYAIVATLIAVACTGLATLAACYKELLAQPATLMRPEAPKIGKRTWIERIPILWKRFNFSWKSSLRNLFRYKKRFFMTLIGIGGCMGLLLVGYGLRDSINSVVAYQYEDLQTYDASAFLGETMSEDAKKQMEAYLESAEGISSHTHVQMVNVNARKGKEKVDTYLTVIMDMENVEQFFTYRDRETHKKYHLQNDGVILSEKTADLLDADVGETIRISLNGIDEKQVKITAICENYMGHYLYLTSDLYAKLYGTQPVYNNLLMKSNLDAKGLHGIGEEILKIPGVLNVMYTDETMGQLNDMLGALDQVMIVLIIVAGMLSFVVLYNLNNININERRRELATLKVLGFHDMEVANYVYRENILLTIFGVLVGCGIGKFLHFFTITTIEIDTAMFGRDVYLASYGICALYTFGFSLLVNAMMFFKLKKIDMVESLKSVE